MNRAFVLAVCGLAACSKTTTSGPSEQPKGLTVTVGTGSTGFEPLVDGASVSVVPGLPGGSHIWGALRAERIATGPAKVQYRVELAGDSPGVISTSDYQLNVDGDPWEWAGFVGLVPNPDDVQDQPVRLRFTIEDSQGHTATADAKVVAHAGAAVVSSALTPSPRGDFASVLDPEGHQLVLFGGDPSVPVQCASTPQFNGETWTFDLANKTWTKLDVEGPSARAGHASAFDSKRRRLLIYGGRFRDGATGPYTLYNETWALDVAAHSWSKLETNGIMPSGVANAIAVYDPEGDRLIVYGGNSSADSLDVQPRTDTWILSLATNTWSVVLTSAPWPGREYHAGVWNPAGHRLLIFGGASDDPFFGPFLNDVWSLDPDMQTWAKLEPTGDAPELRLGSMAAMDADHNRMLVFGGRASSEPGERNDLWALELEPLKWVKLREGDTQTGRASNACDFPADLITPDLESPERRESAFFGIDPSSKSFVLYGGKTDCGNIGDVWTLNADASAWQRMASSFVGESCARSGRQNCTSLCF